MKSWPPFLSFSLSQTCVKILLMSIIYSFVDHSRLTCPYDLMGGFLLEIKARKRERERERERERDSESVYLFTVRIGVPMLYLPMVL